VLLDGEAGWRFAVLVGGDGGEEVAGVGEAVGADGAALRQGEGAAVVLADVAAGGAGGKLGAELDAAGDDRDFAGFEV